MLDQMVFVFTDGHGFRAGLSEKILEINIWMLIGVVAAQLSLGFVGVFDSDDLSYAPSFLKRVNDQFQNITSSP